MPRSSAGLLSSLLLAAACAGGSDPVVAPAPDGGEPREARRAAGAPTLVRDPFRGAPVRGLGGDVVFVLGSGFGAAPEVRVGRPGDEPNGALRATLLTRDATAIAVALPRATDDLDRDDPTRVLWVRDGGGGDGGDGDGGAWAGPLPLNDPRPLWLSPARVPERGEPPGLPREIVVVGRNLQLLTEARLGGTLRVALPAAADAADAGAGAEIADAGDRDPRGDRGHRGDRETVSVVVPLPPSLPAGTHTVDVRRAGGPWIRVADGALVVEPAEVVAATVGVASVERADRLCRPDDGRDDTGCLLDAIAAAVVAAGENSAGENSAGENSAGGSERGDRAHGREARAAVRLGPGTWDLDARASEVCVADAADAASGTEADGCAHFDPANGIVLPRGVDLVGAGRERTVVRVGARGRWDAGATFALLGHNRVEGIRFDDRIVALAAAEEFGVAWPPPHNVILPHDATTCEDGRSFSARHRPAATLRLGLRAREAEPGSRVEDVAIIGNRFEGSLVAIVADGFAVERLTIAGNEIQGFRDGMRLLGAPARELDAAGALFDLVDGAIVGNVFHDSPYSGLRHSDCRLEPGLGTIAAQIGASTRLRVARNRVDGCADDDEPGCGPTEGFRAGFFFSMHDSHEMLLVEDNDFIQTGRKAGDGEAITTDINRDRPFFAGPVPVAAAGAAEVRVDARAHPPLEPEAALDDVFRDHWLQVVAGTGAGQTRKLAGYRVERDREGRIAVAAFRVDPPFDVAPDATSLVTVQRQAWQTYFAGNRVDARVGPGLGCDPGLALDDPTGVDVGVIQLYSTSADSVILGNRLTCANGIRLGASASAPGTPQRTILTTAILDNVVDRDPKEAFSARHAFALDCKPVRPGFAAIDGGIQLTAYMDHPGGARGPAVLLAISVAGNTVRDATYGTHPCNRAVGPGAIAVDLRRADRDEGRPVLVRDVAIWNNAIDLAGARERWAEGGFSPTGIDSLPDVVVATRCNPVLQGRIERMIVCDDGARNEDPGTVGCDGRALALDCR